MSIEKLKRENAALKAAHLKMESQVKEMESQVKEMRHQLKMMQTFLDSLGEGVVACNLKGEFLTANPVAVEIVGMGTADGEGRPEEWAETYGTFHPDKVTLFPANELPLYKAIQGEATEDVEVFIRNPNRPQGVFISVSGSPLYDETGSLIGGVVAFRDISQLKRSHEQLETIVNQLQTQNALMDAIFNSISDGVIVANKDGKYVMFNKTAQEMGGYNPDNISVKHSPETFGLFEPDGKTLFSPDKLPIARVLRGEYPDNVEMVVRNQRLPYEISVSVSARPIYDENGAVNGGVSLIRDISEIKTAHNQITATNEQLETRTQLLHSILHSISDGVVVAGETSNVIMANQSSKRIIGQIPFLKSSDEWFKPDLYFYPDKVTPLPMEEHPLFKAIWGKSTDGVEMFIRSDEVPDGIYASVSGRPLQDRDGNWRGGVAIFHDITDRVNTETALAQAFAQGRLEIVDTILHNIGNAINSVSVGIDTIHYQLTNDQLTPRLTALANAIEQHQNNFSDYVKNDPQGQKVLPFILTLSTDFNIVKQQWKQTVQRIRDRTGHIVDIIRTQNSYNTTSGLHKDINLIAAISAAVKILQESINKRQIQIEIDCDEVPEEIRIQESQFHQMLVNLTQNSIDAIDALAEAGEHTEAHRIQFRAYVNDAFLHLDITDSGIGIDPEHINKIFSSGFTTKEHGSGLGLHSSANFVANSGGKIQAFSEGKGQGTTIQIRFRSSSVYPHNYRASMPEGN